MQTFIFILLGCFYLVALCFLLRWINRKNTKQIPATWLMGAFVLKVIAGFTYGYVYAHFFPSSDSWGLFNESLKEYDYLLHQPTRFFSLEVDFRSLSDVFDYADNAAWKNFDDNLFIKLLGLINLFSFGNYYVSVVIFNIIPTLGLYYIYLSCCDYFKADKQWLALIIFALPSCLFWNSGLHKDGIILFFSGIFIYAAYTSAYLLFKWKQVVLIIISLFFLFMLRNIAALLLIPPLIALWLATTIRKNALLIFSVTHLVFAGLFFLSAYGPQQYNMPFKLAEKQHEFLNLKGNSFIGITKLEPNLSSYMRVFPEALNHALIRPYVTEVRNPFQLMAFLELMLMLAMVSFSIIKQNKYISNLGRQPFSLFLLFAALLSLSIIGYTVPFSGAIVRYKALYALLLLIPFVQFLGRNKPDQIKL